MKKVYWGISALHHDAALCVITSDDDGFRLMYASHAERYSRVKNDINIQPQQIEEALAWGVPDSIYWYENHWKKRARWIRSGEFTTAFTEPNPTSYVRDLLKTVPGYRNIPLLYGDHHKSHLYSLLSTNPYSEPVTRALIVDAVGESQCSTMWIKKSGHREQLISEEKFPRSLGMLYAAVTQHVGLKPMEEEYIVMGMAAYGESRNRIIDILKNAYFRGNLQRGFDEPTNVLLKRFDSNDIAASVQTMVYRTTMQMLEASSYRDSSFGISGGVGLNCVNNQKLATTLDAPLWVFPNAGDAGACVGAVMQHFPHEKLCDWSPYAGTNLGVLSPEQTASVIENLLRNKVCGVAHGKAEFGPRALGNRSILGDPRDITVKERVNQYKNRQQFRPLAPMVLEEDAHTYFNIPANVLQPARYMQVTVNVKDKALNYIPAVVHFDNTARIQIVKNTDPVARILNYWKARTGCPVLMNTSLNIRGEPLVNSKYDATRFENTVKIPVIIPHS